MSHAVPAFSLAAEAVLCDASIHPSAARQLLRGARGATAALQPFPPQHTLAQIRRDRLTAYVALYRALGGGWNLTDAQWSGQNEAASQQRERWPWIG